MVPVDDPAQHVAAKWPYRTTLVFLATPGIALWAAVISACVYYL